MRTAVKRVDALVLEGNKDAAQEAFVPRYEENRQGCFQKVLSTKTKQVVINHASSQRVSLLSIMRTHETAASLIELRLFSFDRHDLMCPNALQSRAITGPPKPRHAHRTGRRTKRALPHHVGRASHGRL